MPEANDAQIKRLRRVFVELVKLDGELQQHGDRDLGDAVKRARRELELVDRQGLLQSRGRSRL